MTPPTNGRHSPSFKVAPPRPMFDLGSSCLPQLELRAVSIGRTVAFPKLPNKASLDNAEIKDATIKRQ